MASANRSRLRTRAVLGKYAIDSTPTLIFPDRNLKKLGLWAGEYEALNFRRLAETVLAK
ncbi:MAG: hypothetical protein NT080_10185 [Spirochaetes bacterium]|nr:hypothetical protein [Spirochaetota bacterium]